MNVGDVLKRMIVANDGCRPLTSEDRCRRVRPVADSYPLSSRGLMALFLCVFSDKLGKNDLQS